MNELAIPTKITDICGARDSALMKLRQAFALIETAESEINHVSRYSFPSSDVKPRVSFEKMVKQLDELLWRFSFDYTGFMQIMDAEAKSKFMDEVERKAPPFTIENIRATFLQFAQDADMMYARGIVNVFLRLSKDHKTNTNEPFKVNERAVLSGFVNQAWTGGTLHVNYHSWASERINDIDRVFKTLDGQKHTPRGLEDAINNAWKEKGVTVYEDDYYRIKGFKNSNMHIQFKRADLLEKANRIISEFYNGQALAGKPRR